MKPRLHHSLINRARLAIKESFYGDMGLLVRKRTRFKVAVIFVLILAALIITRETRQTHLQEVLDRGTLKVATRLGPLIYYQRDEQPGGLDYYLVKAFAERLGVELDIQLYEDLAGLLSSVETKERDLAAANLTVTPARSRRVTFTEPYLEVTSVLIQHSSRDRPTSLSEIREPVVVIAGSSHAEVLAELNRDLPFLQSEEEAGTIMFELMQRIQDEEIAYAVIDSSIYELEQPFFPRVEVAMQLDQPSPVAFALPASDDSLKEAFDLFLEEFTASGEMAFLTESVFSHNEAFNVAGSLVLRERMDDMLPDLEPLFRQVANEFGMDWLLLAAIAYQESHWDPRARSYTGVRGMMMLTLPTAEQFGVDDRLDPQQSLQGGAAYLLNLRDRLPERITEPDRTKLALAAYNVGMGHLEDARVLTDRAGQNPDLWENVREHLPLLQQSTYYKTVKHGYARGTEAATYVENIYHFYNILESWAWQRELELINRQLQLEAEGNEEPEARHPNILDRAIAPL